MCVNLNLKLTITGDHNVLFLYGLPLSAIVFDMDNYVFLYYE